MPEYNVENTELRPSTTEHSSLRRTDYSVRRYSDHRRTGSVIVVNIRRLDLKESYVISVE